MAIVVFRTGRTADSTITVRVSCVEAPELINNNLKNTAWTLQSVSYVTEAGDVIGEQ